MYLLAQILCFVLIIFFFVETTQGSIDECIVALRGGEPAPVSLIALNELKSGLNRTLEHVGTDDAIIIISQDHQPSAIMISYRRWLRLRPADLTLPELTVDADGFPENALSILDEVKHQQSILSIQKDRETVATLIHPLMFGRSPMRARRVYWASAQVKSRVTEIASMVGDREQEIVVTLGNQKIGIIRLVRVGDNLGRADTVHSFSELRHHWSGILKRLRAENQTFLIQSRFGLKIGFFPIDQP